MSVPRSYSRFQIHRYGSDSRSANEFKSLIFDTIRPLQSRAEARSLLCRQSLPTALSRRGLLPRLRLGGLIHSRQGFRPLNR